MEIRFDDVSFNYPNGVEVLHDIDLTLNGPGLVCIIGPNGVGKSTLVKCINRLLKPTTGKVYLNGKDVSEYSLKELSSHIGFVPTSSQNCFSMPVIDSIMIGRHNHQKWKTTDEDIERVYRVMKLVGIEDLSMRGHSELSAGQLQKVSLARGLIQETEIFVLDEPTSNLDVKHQVYVTELLRGIAKAKGMMVIMISHDLNLSSKYADMIVIMAEPGRIYSVGTPEEVITRDMVVEVYGVDCEIIDRRGRPCVVLGTVVPDKDDERQGPVDAPQNRPGDLPTRPVTGPLHASMPDSNVELDAFRCAQ